ncbi:MAG: fibronectin type III domain-containing protein [Patescibacteria group bacterium]
MKHFGGPSKGNWWEKKPGNPRVSWFLYFREKITDRPPLWKRVARPVLVIVTALTFALAGIMPTIQEHVRVARAATLTVCASGCDYATIILAVNASSNGDTISIGTGTFYVTSTLNLASKAKIFDGGGAANTTLIASTSATYIFSNTTDAGLATTYTIKEMTINEQSGTAPGILTFNNQTTPVTVNFTDNTVTSFGNTSRGIIAVSSGNTSGITGTITGNTVTMDGSTDIVVDWDGVGTTSTITFATNTVTNGATPFDFNNGSDVGSTLTVNGNTASGFGTSMVSISGGTTVNVYSNTVTGANTNEGIVIYPDTGGTTSVYSNSLTMGDGTSNNGIDVFLGSGQVTGTQMNIYRNLITGSDIGIDITGNGSSAGAVNVYNNVLYALNSSGITTGGENMVENIFNNTIDNSPAGINGGSADSGTQLNIINNSLSDTGKGGQYVLSCGTGNEKIYNNNVYTYTNLNNSCGTYSIGGQGNINVVPGYANHNGSDFSLSATSTCASAADNCDSGMASTTIFQAHVSSGGANTLVSATDLAQIDMFNGLGIAITAGTGSGQTNTVSDVVSSTDTITVSSNWSTQPDSTSVFRVYLDITNDYSGNTRPDAGTSIADIGAYELVTNTAPTPPSTLYASSTSAQSGSTNPSNVSSTSPYFSAIANDSDATENLVKARVQVGTDSTFASNVYWDSQQTAIATTTKGNRISDIQFNNFGATATTTLSLNDGDVTYYWRIKLWDDGSSNAEGAWSSVSSTASFTLVDVPTTTSGVAAAYVSDSAITVTWTDNSSTETGFVIQRSANEGSYSTVSTTDLGIISYSDTSVSANSQYIYRVAAQNAAGTSAYTTSTAVATTPSAATSATTTYNSDTSVTVAWTDNSSYESGFVVQSSVNDGSYSTASTTATSTVSYPDTSTAADNKYIYRIFARNSFATSTAVTSTAVYTSSDAPTIGSPTVNSTSSIAWAWTDNSNYEETFRLDFTTGSGTDVDDIASTSASQTTTGLSLNTQYAVHIHAYRSDRGESTASATSSAVYTHAAIPGTVSASSQTTGALTVTWSAGSNPASTEFYVDNITAGTNSGWITGTSTAFSSLNAGTPYSFRVKARNGDAVETSSASTTEVSTLSQGGSSGGGGDGGGGAGAPSVTAGPDVTTLPKEKENLEKEELGSFYINDGAKWTNKLDVTLGFNVAKVTHLAVADNPTMKGGSIVPYASSMKWTLAKGDGPKMLYAQFYDLTRGVKSAVVKVSILLDGTPPGAPKITNAPPYEDISDWLKNGGQLKGTSDPEVRIVLLLQRTDLTDKIRKKVLELRALRRKAQGLKEQQQTTKKKAEEAKRRAEETQKEVNALLEEVQELQRQLDALQGEEATAQAERERLLREEQAIRARINALESEKKSLEKEEKKGPTKIQVSEHGSLKTAEEFFEEVRIAAVNKTTHKTESDTQGDWAYTFAAGTFNTQGEYSIAANAEDGGGNKSGSTETSFATLSGDAPKTTEPPKEEEKAVTTTPTKKLPEPTKEEPKETTVKKPVQPAQEPTETKPAPVIAVPGETGQQSVETGGTPSGGEGAPVSGGEAAAGGEAASGAGQPQTVAETITQATEIVTAVAQAVAETATVVAKETVKEVTRGVVQTYQVAKVVADNPVVEKVNETVAAPTVAAAAVANVASSTTTLPTMLLYLRFLFLQPSMLFGRKKKRAWGVVYNGFTKVPVDLALVRLVMKEKGQVLQSRVTDVAGRYYFLAKQGEYMLEVAKPGFGPVSKHLAKVEEDGEFKPIYHGDAIAVTVDATPVQPCVPLDPDAKKEDVKTTVKRNVWKHVQQGVSGVGFGFSMASFAVSPSWWVGALLGVHVTSFLFFRRLSKRERGANQFGTIKDKSTGKSIAQAVVRIFDVEYNKLLDTRVTDKDGRYVFLVGRNKYYLMIEAPGFAQYLSQPITMNEMGAIVADIALVPGFKSAEAPTPELAAALAAGERKEKEAEVRDPSKTRISADGIPQPSVGFLKNMGVMAETLSKGMLGAEMPLVAAGVGGTQQNNVTQPSTQPVSGWSPKFASSEDKPHTGGVAG